MTIYSTLSVLNVHHAKLNIHVALRGDKPFALDNFCPFERLPESVKTRLTVENDDKKSLYSTQELYDGIYKRVCLLFLIIIIIGFTMVV